MTNKNNNKRYLITGGASGLGKALAMRLAVKYANTGNSNTADDTLKICIADMHQDRATETVAQLSTIGVDAFFQPCDITNAEDIDTLHTVIRQKWQGIDVVINNAGVATGGSLQSESIEQWQWILDVNLLGMVRMSQCFLNDFKQQGHGYFVNVASQAGLTPIPLMSSYNAVKSAVIGLSETMKLELAADNIDVSVVCPSFFKTNLGESLRTTEPSMNNMMHKWFDRAPLTSTQVADRIIEQMAQRKFMIMTHEEGIKAYRMKRWLPIEWYLGMMIKKTKAIIHKVKGDTQTATAQPANTQNTERVK